MATTRRLPPARFVIHERSKGLTNRVVRPQLFNASKKYGGAQGGNIDPGGRGFLYRFLDLIQVNPAHEQPKMVYNSGAQPIIRWGWRRYVRTFMTAGPRFYGRWFFAGTQVNQFVARGRMTGVTTRKGTTYLSPRFQTGPRAILLGSRK